MKYIVQMIITAQIRVSLAIDDVFSNIMAQSFKKYIQYFVYILYLFYLLQVAREARANPGLLRQEMAYTVDRLPI